MDSIYFPIKINIVHYDSEEAAHELKFNFWLIFGCFKIFLSKKVDIRFTVYILLKIFFELLKYLIQLFQGYINYTTWCFSPTAKFVPEFVNKMFLTWCTWIQTYTYFQIKNFRKFWGRSINSTLKQQSLRGLKVFEMIFVRFILLYIF